jgi:hypothetical protein
MHPIARRFASLLALVFLVALSVPVEARPLLSIDEVTWENRGVPPDQTVLFTLPFENPDPETTPPTQGRINAQEFGAFLPDVDLICDFTIPPIPPSGRVEVTCEIGLEELPGNSPRLDAAGNWLFLPGSPAPPGYPSIVVVGCPLEDYWGGGIDVVWEGSEPGQAIIHRGILPVCFGLGISYIRISTNCTDGGGISWSFSDLCPGWNANLVNSVFTQAPNPLPPGPWTGWIEVSSNLLLGETCDLDLDMTCGTGIAVINVMGQVCQCDRPVPNEPSTWGRIKSTYPR